ncbi:hypothetical protein EJB05_43598 [Eragrostis curvula]|uniref:Uncharacterized protein n=1 Tax=Eragrostis curvula TaxID=38414 RepID=A0A5J9TFB0_9POAL|nr:hypothetical protein EJB05_43598 [Eragrostis curvula]
MASRRVALAAIKQGDLGVDGEQAQLQALPTLTSIPGFISEEKAMKRTSLLWERGEDLCRTLNPCRRTAHSWYNLVWYILHVLTSPMVYCFNSNISPLHSETIP